MNTPASPVPLRDMPWRTRLAIVALWGFLGVVVVKFGVAAFELHPVIGIAYTSAGSGLAAFLYAGRHDRNRHRLLFTAWAAAHGWEYSPHSAVLVGRWTVPPFCWGPRKAIDVLHGVVGGLPVTSFTHSGPDWSIRWRSSPGLHVVMATFPAAFPALRAMPEDSASRTADALGAQDIAVESAEFNRRWRVECGDTRFAHAVLHPRLMERLLAPDVEDMSLLLEDRDVALYASGPTPLEDLERRAALLVDVVRLIPPYLLSDHPQPPRPVRRRRKER